MIEVHLLRYALAAADTGSFSRAADQFRVKQSTLSKSVQFLEHRLGLSIFSRSTRGVIPTDPGKIFLGRARQIIEDIDALGRDSTAFARGHVGTLRIAFSTTLAAGDLSAAIKGYAARYPDIEIRATEGTRTALLHALSAGRVDLAVLPGQSDARDIRSQCFWSEPLSIAIAPDNPLAAREKLYWTDLRDCSFLVSQTDPGPDIAMMIRTRLAGPGHSPNIIVQDVSPESLMSFVRGNRVAVTSGNRQILSAGAETPSLREPLDAFGATRLDQGVHWLASNDSPALRNFLDLLAQRYGRPLVER
ncbi:MAG: hypothetical protein JWR80_4225 [Bradyrhizobium sp.]|nr:hypothetical protein [Bradyrhizobium sp.]